MCTLRAIDVFYGLVSIQINWNYVNIHQISGYMKRKRLGFCSDYDFYENLTITHCSMIFIPYP